MVITEIERDQKVRSFCEKQWIEKEKVHQKYDEVWSLCEDYWINYGRKVYLSGMALDLAEREGWTEVDRNWTFFCKDIGHYIEDRGLETDISEEEIDEVIIKYLFTKGGLSLWN